MKTGKKIFAALAAGVLLTTFTIAACLPDRFPVCKSNEECAAKNPEAPTCYNLRCMECHYDADCDGGRTCNVSSHCASVSDVHPDISDVGGDAGSAEPTKSE